MVRTRLTLPLFLLASATSLFGNAAIAIVLPWLVLERTGDPALTGLVAAASGAPAAVAALVGGHLVDRVGRRRVSVLADLGSALAVASLAVVDAAVGLTPAAFVALGVLGALFDVPGMTARQALLADVARASGVSLDKVAAAQSTLFGLSFLAGPALAGLLLAAWPPITVVWVTAACSASAAALTALMPLDVGGTETADVPASPLEGLQLVRADVVLASLLAISLASMLFVAPLLSVVLPTHFRGLGRPEQLGLSLSAYAVGTMVGAGLYGAALGKRRWRAWVVAQLLYALSFAMIATLAGFWPVAVGMAVAGVASGLEQPIVQVLLSERIPDAVRGRVFAVFSALSTLASPLGLGLFALLLTGFPLQTGAMALSVVCALTSVAALLQPHLRRSLTGTAHAHH